MMSGNDALGFWVPMIQLGTVSEWFRPHWMRPPACVSDTPPDMQPRTVAYGKFG